MTKVVMTTAAIQVCIKRISEKTERSKRTVDKHNPILKKPKAFTETVRKGREKLVQ